MTRWLARYFVAAALALSSFDAALAAPTTCRTDADCSPPATVCRSFSLSDPPQRLCVLPMPAAATLSTGANFEERLQERRITDLLADLSKRVGGLQPKTLSELRDVLDGEVRARRLDEATFIRELSQAHAALLQLDRYERLVLIRYLKRHFSTELERWLFIILDIIRHPDLDTSTELAALDLRISAETMRLQGIVSDRGAECAQRAVIDQLMRQRNAIELPLEIRRIEASNVPPERRAAQIEVARQSRRHAQEMLSKHWLGNCGGTAASPGQFVMPPIPKASTPERPVYAVYSLDPPEVAVLADAAGIPPVSSGKWAVDRAGKRFAQQQAKTEQAKRVSEGRQPFVRQANEEVGQAQKSLDAEIQALTAGGPCPNARDACDAAMKAALKRYQSSVSSAADRLLAAPVGAPPVTKRPSYAGLQPYDADGQFLQRRFPKTGFFKWIFDMVAENLALEALERHTRIKLDPLPPSMIGASEIAEHLLKLPKVKTSPELGCWGADLHAALIFPYAPNIGEKINLMTQSVMQLKDPRDPGFVDCRKEKK